MNNLWASYYEILFAVQIVGINTTQMDIFQSKITIFLHGRRRTCFASKPQKFEVRAFAFPFFSSLLLFRLVFFLCAFLMWVIGCVLKDFCEWMCVCGPWTLFRNCTFFLYQKAFHRILLDTAAHKLDRTGSISCDNIFFPVFFYIGIGQSHKWTTMPHGHGAIFSMYSSSISLL